MPAVAPRSTVAMSSPSVKNVQSALPMVLSLDRRRDGPCRLEALVISRARRERRRRSAAGWPRGHERLVREPAVFEVFVRLTIELREDCGDLGPVDRERVG